LYVKRKRWESEGNNIQYPRTDMRGNEWTISNS